MSDPTDDLPDAIKSQARKIIREIENAGSLVHAVKIGAKADGFVVGIACSGGLTEERCDLLSVYFDSILETRLRSLTLGL